MGLVAFVAAVAGVAVAGVAHGAVPDSHSPPAQARLPLISPGTNLPSRDRVTLKSGKEAGEAWYVFLYRPSRSGLDRRICVVAATSRMRRGGGESVVTGSSSCHAPSSSRGFWRLATTIRLRPATRILALVFGQAAKRLELIRSSGRIDVMRPDRLTRLQAERIGTHSLGFLVVRDHPTDCYESLRILARGGRRIGATPLAPCQ